MEIMMQNMTNKTSNALTVNRHTIISGQRVESLMICEKVIFKWNKSLKICVILNERLREERTEATKPDTHES